MIFENIHCRYGWAKAAGWSILSFWHLACTCSTYRKLLAASALPQLAKKWFLGRTSQISKACWQKKDRPSWHLNNLPIYMRWSAHKRKHPTQGLLRLSLFSGPLKCIPRPPAGPSPSQVSEGFPCRARAETSKKLSKSSSNICTALAMLVAIISQVLCKTPTGRLLGWGRWEGRGSKWLWSWMCGRINKLRKKQGTNFGQLHVTGPHEQGQFIQCA